ncbi:MAG: RNA-binding S4 domain-containing protein [candidate division WOR-3 bacterium]|nr:MAG: RNA-binding S4 domain-containing protein [candidate division WOR-3 bacterium]
MRIDQYLRKTMIIKQRETAKRLCDEGYIWLNGHNVKPSKHVAVGDLIEIEMMDERCKYRVVSIPLGNVKKKEQTLYCEEVKD